MSGSWSGSGAGDGEVESAVVADIGLLRSPRAPATQLTWEMWSQCTEQEHKRHKRMWNRFVMNYSAKKDYALHLRLATILARRRTSQLLKHCRRPRLALKLVAVVDKHNGASRALLDVVVGNTKITERALSYKTNRVREFLMAAKFSWRLTERLIADPASLSPKERKWQQEDLQGFSFQQLIAAMLIQRWWRNHPRELSELPEYTQRVMADNGTVERYPTRHCPSTCRCRCSCQGIRSCIDDCEDKPKCPNMYYDKRRLIDTYGPDAVTNVGGLTIPKDYYGKLQSFFSPGHPCSGEDKRRMFRKTGRYFGSHGHPIHRLLSDTSREDTNRWYRKMCGDYVRLVWPEVHSVFRFEDLLNRVGLLLLGRFVFLQNKVLAGLAEKGYPYDMMEYDSPHGLVIMEFLKTSKSTFSLGIQSATGVVYDHSFQLDRALQAYGIEWPQIGFHPVMYPMVLGRFAIGAPATHLIKPVSPPDGATVQTRFDVKYTNGHVACALSCEELGLDEFSLPRSAEFCNVGQRVSPFSSKPFDMSKATATITRISRPPSTKDYQEAMSGVWSKRHEEWAVKNILQRPKYDYMDKYGRELDYDLSFLSLRDHLDWLNAWRHHFTSTRARRMRGYSHNRSDCLWSNLNCSATIIQQKWRAIRLGRLERATVIPEFRSAAYEVSSAAAVATAADALAFLDDISSDDEL